MIEMRKAIQACLDDPLTAGLDSATKSAQICLVIAPFLQAVPVEHEPIEVTERAVATLAKHMANVASDWADNCDDDDHSLEHSNWGAYMDDARRALVAALGGGDQPC